MIGLLASLALGAGLDEVLVDGDIILHQSQSSQSAALRAATGSPWTHVGLVFRRDDSWQVIEAVEPVKWTPLEAWLRRGSEQHVIVMRLREPLTEESALGVRAASEAYLGLHYDVLFQWSDERIYCSELVYKAYKEAVGVEVGALTPMGEFDLTSPEVQALIEARAAHVDASELVVSPASLLTDADLVQVYSSVTPP